MTATSVTQVFKTSRNANGGEDINCPKQQLDHGEEAGPGEEQAGRRELFTAKTDYNDKKVP